MKRIGVLGGTFNPIHMGHLAIAQMAQERFVLEKVIFVPCNLPPHKRVENLAPARDRYHMVRLAIKGHPLFDISDFEVKRRGKSYTIDTLEYLRDIYPPKTKIFFIIGGDSFPYLETWRRIEDILDLASFIVVNRPGYRRKRTGIPHHSVIMPGIDISSSFLRRRVAQGKSIKYLVPDAVFQYINQQKLYRNR